MNALLLVTPQMPMGLSLNNISIVTLVLNTIKMESTTMTPISNTNKSISNLKILKNSLKVKILNMTLHLTNQLSKRKEKGKQKNSNFNYKLTLTSS
jgi:hypothetical protein